MKKLFAGMLVALWCVASASAQTARVVQSCGTLPQSYASGATRDITQDVNGNACIAGTFSATGGTISNATSGQATTATNQGSVSYLYGFNGTTWDQLQVDAAKNLKVANPVGITPTDHTITSASGASQQIMAANASRHSLMVVNTGTANCGVNPTGGTAAIGGAGTITLVPTGSYTPRVPTLSAVTIICTAAQPIYADDN